MSKSSQNSWFNRCLPTLGRQRAGAPSRRRLLLGVESLEDRKLLATLNIAAGILTYTAAAGEVNQLKVSNFGGVLKFTEAPGINITLTGAGTAGWSGNGTNSVSGPSISVTAASVIDVQDLSDKVTIQGFPVSSLTVNGGAGDDKLSRAGAFPSSGDTWNLTGAGSGTITSVLTFANMEDLIGGGKADTFTVNNAGSLAGGIDAGGGYNVLDYSPSSLAVTFSISAQTAVNVTDTIPFSHIFQVTGSSASDTLIGGSGANSWTQANNNAGGVFNFDTAISYSYVSIENLTGGNAVDTFFVGTYTTSGVIDGGGGVRNAIDYSGVAGPVTVNLTTNSIPTVIGGVVNIQDITGSFGNDTLIGDSNANLLNGYIGVDILLGEGGNDTLDGGAGNDDDYLDGGAGTNTLRASANGTVLLADDYYADLSNSDTLVNIQKASLTGSSSNDFIEARDFSGDVTADGKEGNDTIIGGTGNNTISGGTGNDTLTGLIGDDFLFGGDGNDKLFGGSGSDTLDGQAGDDYMKGGPDNDAYLFDTDTAQGADRIDESAGGTDRISFFPTDDLAVTLNLGISAQQTVNANLKLTLSSVEQATGGAKDDVLIGNGSANKLTGGDGNDVLVGQGGADIIDGQNGRDILIGGAGGDTLTGGSDNDVLIGGNTSFDGNIAVLLALMAEWTSNNSYSARISHLTGATSGGLNGGFTLHGPPSATVFDDAIADTLTGGDNLDWFLARAGDTTDKTASETLTTI